ncbi:MAG: hypothetical protein A2V66_10780 [Ignavibacteria bacterium RBG_13_36_8]|nr:MAG: hypothetical protein A2V66_10780 [Ignavibacteria bacterium RBG_13_36_8]
MQQENLEVTIRARIEQVLGKDKLEQDLTESAQKISRIGEESSGKVTGLIGELPRLSEEDQRSFDKIQKAVTAQSKIIDEKAQELLSGYLEQEEIGMTKAQTKSWQRKFKGLGTQSTKDIDELIKFIGTEAQGVPEDKREYFEMLKASVKDMSDEISKSYDEMSRSIKNYHESVKGAGDEQEKFFRQLQRSGYLAIIGGLTNQAGNILLTEARISARERTAFDFTSPIAAYTEQKQLELFEETQERSMLFSTIGMLLFGGAAAAAGGGAIGAVVGGSFGANIGNRLAEILNTKKEAEVEEELKFLGQAYNTGLQMVEEYRPYDIEATKLGIRFGGNLRGSMGLGYTKEQELKYKEVFADSLRNWEEDKYEDQLRFARATGLNPEEVMRLNRYSRITGADYSLTNLDAVRQYSKEIFGESADSKRVIDILESIAKINMEMLKVSADAESREAAKFAALPALLFGVDNPYGRLGDLGEQTISQLTGLGVPKSEAHQALLYQAYSSEGSGFFGEGGVLARMRGGMFYKDNLQRILKTLRSYSGGSEEISEAMLYDILPTATPELIERLSGIISGRGSEIITGYNKDKSPIKTKITSIEEFIGWQEKVKEKLSGEGKSDDEITKTVQEYIAGGKKAMTDFESTQERISRIHGEIAESWKKSILYSQESLANIQERMLQSGQVQVSTINKVIGAFEKMTENVKRFGGYYSGEEITADYYKGAYDKLYGEAYRRISFDNNNLPEDKRLSPDVIKDMLLSKGKGTIDYIEHLATMISEHTVTRPGPDLFTEELTGREEVRYWKRELTKIANKVLAEKEEKLNKFQEGENLINNVSVKVYIDGIEQQPSKITTENSTITSHSE